MDLHRMESGEIITVVRKLQNDGLRIEREGSNVPKHLHAESKRWRNKMKRSEFDLIVENVVMSRLGFQDGCRKGRGDA